MKRASEREILSAGLTASGLIEGLIGEHSCEACLPALAHCC